MQVIIAHKVGPCLVSTINALLKCQLIIKSIFIKFDVINLLTIDANALLLCDRI